MSPTDPTFVQAYEAVWAGEPVALDVDVIEVHGPDAFDYLQGQLSQDVGAMVVSDAVVPSLLLGPPRPSSAS